MITQTELEELIREHGLAPYVYIKNEKEQFKIKLMSHANYITWRENPHQTALLTIAKDTNHKNIIKKLNHAKRMIDQERLRVYDGLTDLYKLILEKRRLKEHYEKLLTILKQVRDDEQTNPWFLVFAQNQIYNLIDGLNITLGEAYILKGISCTRYLSSVSHHTPSDPMWDPLLTEQKGNYMRNNFDDLVRERCKDLILAGHLTRVIAAQQFMGHTDQQFGEFLAPLIQKETITEEPQEVTSEKSPQETSVPNIRTGTVHLKPGYYAVCDETGAEIFTGNIGEYRALDLHHGQIVEFRNDSHEIINQNLGDDPSAPLLHYIKHGIVELEPDSQELYIAKDINGQTIKELGCAFDIFYLRQMADRFNIHAGDTVDLYLKEDGYPYINWVYRTYDSETTVQNISTVRKRTKTERESRSSIDYDLTDKKVAIYGIPPRMIQEIENTLIKEKGADSVEVQQLGTYSAGYKVGKAKMLDNTDLVIIAKTGISHSMSYDIVNVCKENNIPFAYANQPSLKRIEMAIYRALNGYPSDEISAGDLQYPEIKE